jgi:hypothetical protein
MLRWFEREWCRIWKVEMSLGVLKAQMNREIHGLMDAVSCRGVVLL